MKLEEAVLTQSSCNKSDSDSYSNDEAETVDKRIKVDVRSSIPVLLYAF